jgi:hypothetical protein
LKRLRKAVSKTKSKKKRTDESGEQQNEGKSEDDFAEFVSKAIREPRGGAYEQLLSQFLAQAVICTDPLKRIKVVCEAALMIPEAEREDLTIDYETVEVLNAVTNALLNSTKNRGDVISISWGFQETEENGQKFIGPWQKTKIWYYPDLLRTHVEFYPYYGYGIRKIKRIITEPFWSWFFDATNCLSMEGYNLLRNSFVAWAIPQIQLYLSELTHVVSPSLYGEVIGLYTRSKKRDYAEKVKEVSEATTKDADSMDSGL